MSDNKVYLYIVFLLLVFVTACGNRPNALSVLEVLQNADSLDGKTIRVRGQAYLWLEPTREEMWMFGGCAINPDGSLLEQGDVIGWLTLYDYIDPIDLKNYGVPHDEIGVKISESSIHCDGNYCTMSCSPFKIVSGETYEFVGVLRVKEEPDLILENIDLNRSRQLVEGKWIPIPTGNFGLMFP